MFEVYKMGNVLIEIEYRQKVSEALVEEKNIFNPCASQSVLATIH